ncbi:MAG TPA: PepSY domain-containing protein [Thermomonas sp.]|jgi:uncharacterized iron-regulated membrane protein|nr:PepSY domain-containing protein [Thermomonas sp.]HPW11810.1 PepSY domain-containing protein [Thermomonas sp.]
MDIDTQLQGGRDMRRRAWRWHFLAALLVIPFVLWQSATGTLYLWSEAWVDQRHPDLRFVEPAPRQVSLDVQLRAARDFQPGAKVANVLLPVDPARSTQVTFAAASGLPLAVFVDPHRGVVLGSLEGAAWPVGWTRSLHGGWPLGDAGSWLLELGACWTIVMVLSGLYLWWPRDGRGWRALLPRLRSGGWTFWRDLHACVAVWFSLLIVLFLFTALPWTSFWGNKVLLPVQQALGQQGPRAAGFAPVFAGEAATEVGSLQQMLEQARSRGMAGDLMFTMVDGPPGSAVSLRSVAANASDERYLLLDRANAQVLDDAGWSSFPLMAKTVATGVKLHEADYFGRSGRWVNTAFALALAWLCVTGTMAWWRRKPARSLGVPPPSQRPWPWWLRVLALVGFLVLPLLALSAALLWLAENAWAHFANCRSKRA